MQDGDPMWVTALYTGDEYVNIRYFENITISRPSLQPAGIQQPREGRFFVKDRENRDHFRKK